MIGPPEEWIIDTGETIPDRHSHDVMKGGTLQNTGCTSGGTCAAAMVGVVWVLRDARGLL